MHARNFARVRPLQDFAARENFARCAIFPPVRRLRRAIVLIVVLDVLVSCDNAYFPFDDRTYKLVSFLPF